MRRVAGWTSAIALGIALVSVANVAFARERIIDERVIAPNIITTAPTIGFRAADGTTVLNEGDTVSITAVTNEVQAIKTAGNGGSPSDMTIVQCTITGTNYTMSAPSCNGANTICTYVIAGNQANGTLSPFNLICDGTSSATGSLACSVTPQDAQPAFTRNLNLNCPAASGDTTPDAFTFVDQAPVPLNTLITSAAVTITGITAAAPISVVGGEYSIGCTGTFTATAATIMNNQTVCVRHTSAVVQAANTDTTLTVGGVSDVFRSTTEDTTPNMFTFTDVSNVALLSTQTSNTVTITGLTAPAAISVTGGTYSIGCTGTFTSTAATISNGETVCVRHTAAALPNTMTDTTLTIGGVSDTFTSTTILADTTPDNFTFTDQTNVAQSILITSNTVTITGINAAAGISVTGGEYSIGCTGTFTSTAGSIMNNETVCVRHTSAAAPSTMTNTVLTVGGVSDTFTSTTAANDTTPDAFTFTDQSNVALSTPITSNTVTITGINAAAAISVTGGEYSIGCTGTFTAIAGTIMNNETVCVRHTSAATPATMTNTMLTVGGVSDTFSSTTLAGDSTPNAFTFTDLTDVAANTQFTSNTVTITGIDVPTPISVSGGGGSAYSIGCTGTFVTTGSTIMNNETVCVRHTSAATSATATNTTLNVGGVTDVFTTTTADTVPNAFTFTDQTAVPLSSLRTSNTVTITGITGPTAISVTGGEYSIGCTATFVTTAGTINNNETVCVRHTSAATPATATNTILTIGGVSDTFTSTTVDTVPNAFTFTDQTNVALSTPVTSNTVTITGIDSPTPISVTGGEYSIGCTGTFTPTAATINNNETVCVRHTSAATPATMTNTTLTVGGVSDTFTSTTVAADTTPNAFTFTDQAAVPLNDVRTSNTVTITGINTAAMISVAGGTYSIGCTAVFTAVAGTINNNETVCVRHTSAATENTATNTTLTVGGVTDIFTSTTADLTPNAFTFTDQTNVALSTPFQSNTVTITGINAATSIAVSGAPSSEYSIGCTGTFTNVASTITNGQTVCVRHTSSAAFSTATNTILTVGTVSDTFTTTTLGADTTPDAFTFTDQSNLLPQPFDPSPFVQSNTVTITGLNTGAPISVTGDSGSAYSIGCTGVFTNVAATINNGETVCVRHDRPFTFATTRTTTLTIGGVSDVFSSSTIGVDADPDPFTFTDQTNVARSTLIQSNTVTITGITPNIAISVTGGEYSIGCTGTFTAVAGTVNPGDTVCVRHTSSAAFSTATNTTLTVGNYSDTFTSTTLAQDTTPNAFTFTDVTNVARSTPITSNTVTITGINDPAPISVSGDPSSQYSIGCTGTFTSTAGTISNNETVCVRHTSSAAFSTAVNTTLTVGGVSDVFTSTTLAQDVMPAQFTFTDVTNVPLSSVQTSNTVTITGINDPAPISVVGGSYSIGCTAVFVTASGTINNNETVCVRHTASATPATATDTTLTVGGVSDTFTSTTVPPDTTPDAFVFQPQMGVGVNQLVVSNTVTITGINTGTPISVVNGGYSIGCTGTFTNTPGTINPGQTVCVAHTSSSLFNNSVTTTLTIGGVSATFTSTTSIGAVPTLSDLGRLLMVLLVLAVGLVGFRARSAG